MEAKAETMTVFTSYITRSGSGKGLLNKLGHVDSLVKSYCYSKQKEGGLKKQEEQHSLGHLFLKQLSNLVLCFQKVRGHIFLLKSA